MNYNFENNVLTICIDGKVDTSNANSVEAEITSIRNENPNGSLVFDTENLQYISSAGLRVILRFRKQEKDLKIINTSSEVYDIFEMTGFTEMIDISKAYRKMSVDGCDIIGKGAKGTVYRYSPDTIIKVYNSADSLPSIHRERELARKAFVLGVPTAIPFDVVKVGDKYGSVFELLDAKSVSQLLNEEPQNFEKYVQTFADILKTIHQTSVKADDMPDVKKLVNSWVETDKDFLASDDYNKICKLVGDVADTMNMLHCDYHTNNILIQNGESLLIDMDTLSHGHPIFELANIYITYVGFGENDPSVVEKFIGLSYDVSVKFWNAFLPLYLETTDADKIKDVENKTRLLCYVRLMRHTIRRSGADTEQGRKVIEYCKDKIHTLLADIDTLDF